MKLGDKKIISIIAIVVIIIAIVIGIQFNSAIHKPLIIEDNEIITVNEGDSFYSIIEQLKSERKIKNTIYIKIYTRVSGINVEVLPGKYTLNSEMTVKDIAMALSSEKSNGIALTIPEGFSIDEIATRVAENGICTKEEFIKAVQEYPLPEYVKADEGKRYNLEGFLFPDTYNIDKDTTAFNIIEIMLNRFEEVWYEVSDELQIDVKNNDIEKIITIASMIEKEARVDEERALISSVIYNRVDEDMPLQFCSTVIYAHGYHIEEVLYSHLEIDSPYNTYIYSGLPVGPIANPGIPSIIAALKPEKTDYLYYLLESENKHYFTNNYDDFLKRKEELGY